MAVRIGHTPPITKFRHVDFASGGCWEWFSQGPEASGSTLHCVNSQF
jgi:hypothetical protein